MNRDAALAQIEESGAVWDIVVVGGGATGLGAAVDAAARGYKTLLLERADFAKGTSSRSTKLVHGGVRYLRQGNILLVKEGLKERGLLLRNAPHLACTRAFIVPCYGWWQAAFYGAGLKFYDVLSGARSLGHSRLLSASTALAEIPNLARSRLAGGVLYYDGQFDDARLAVNLAQTMADLGGTPLNYMAVQGLSKTSGRITGVRAHDLETHREFSIRARAVVNATGVFCDELVQMDQPQAPPLITPSQGIHLVFDKKFLGGDRALMVPKTEDGRVLFAIPWQDKAIFGTTDTPVPQLSPEPRALESEIEFVLRHAAHYLDRAPTRRDIKSVFAGLRPLLRNPGSAAGTARLSRDFTVIVSDSGLVTVTGGKWTIYRKMGEAAIDRAAQVAGLEQRPCRTATLAIHGAQSAAEKPGSLSVYGSDANCIRELIRSRPTLGEPLHGSLPYVKAEVAWSVQHELARTVEDVLARRTRALFLDAGASMEAAPEVAALMSAELGRGEAWRAEQVRQYSMLASGYLAP